MHKLLSSKASPQINLCNCLEHWFRKQLRRKHSWDWDQPTKARLKHLETSFFQIISQLFVVCLNRTLRFMAIHLYPTTEISLRLPWSHGTSAVVSPEPPLALASPLRASDQWWHPLGGNTKMDFRWLKVEWVSSVYHMARVLSLPWFRILGKSCFLWKLQGRTASPSLRILGYDFGSPESDNPCSRIMVPWELRGT